jgi:hypothetical protein
VRCGYCTHLAHPETEVNRQGQWHAHKKGTHQEKFGTAFEPKTKSARDSRYPVGPPRGRPTLAAQCRTAVLLAGVSEPADALRPLSLTLLERRGRPSKTSSDEEDRSSSSSEEVLAQPLGRGRGRAAAKKAVKKAVKKAPPRK